MNRKVKKMKKERSNKALEMSKEFADHPFEVCVNDSYAASELLQELVKALDAKDNEIAHHVTRLAGFISKNDELLQQILLDMTETKTLSLDTFEQLIEAVK